MAVRIEIHMLLLWCVHLQVTALVAVRIEITSGDMLYYVQVGVTALVAVRIEMPDALTAIRQYFVTALVAVRIEIFSWVNLIANRQRHRPCGGED